MIPIPTSVIAAAVAGVIAGAAGYTLASKLGSAKLARAEAGWAQERSQAAQAAASASEAYRTQEQAWAASAAKIQSEGEARREQIAADAASARKSADSLRGALAIATRALRSTAAASAPTATECKTTAETGDMLAQLLGRAADRAGELASYADTASAAGDACERAYSVVVP